MKSYVKRAGIALLACQLLLTACQTEKTRDSGESSPEPEATIEETTLPATKEEEPETTPEQTRPTQKITEAATEATTVSPVKETDPPGLNIELPEYLLAPVTSFEANGSYLYAYCLELLEPNEAFNQIYVYVNDSIYQDYVCYDGSVCEYSAFDNVHPDMDQKTFLISSSVPLEENSIHFEADYTEAKSNQTCHNRRLDINASITDITTTQSYLHDSTLFCVDGTYMLRDNSSTGIVRTEVPVILEARVYRFVVLAAPDQANEAIQSFSDNVSLLSGDEDTYCEAYACSEDETIYVSCQVMTDKPYVYELALGIQSESEITKELAESIDRMNFMYIGSGDDGMVFYTLE